MLKHYAVLLRFLAAHSFVASSGGPLAQRFGLTPASQMLAKDATGSLWGAAVIGSADHYDGWQNLEASLRKGASTVAFDDKFGLSIWEHYKRNPTQEKAFAHFMTGVSAGPNAALAMSGVNFSQCERIVDVGGGHGSLMQELVAAFPSLSGAATVFDMPSVVRSAPTIHGVHFKGGDFFDPKTIPRGASTNCYVEKVVLHDWSDTKTVAILKNIATALETAKVPRANRRLFLAEQVLSDGDALQVSKLGLDVNMMVMCGGGERTAGEWAALLDQAGMVHEQCVPNAIALLGDRSRGKVDQQPSNTLIHGDGGRECRTRCALCGVQGRERLQRGSGTCLQNQPTCVLCAHRF